MTFIHNNKSCRFYRLFIRVLEGNPRPFSRLVPSEFTSSSCYDCQHLSLASVSHCTALLAIIFFLSRTAIDPLSCQSAEPREGEKVASNLEDLADKFPRQLHLEPSEAINSFQIDKEFRIKLVAAEPLIVDSVADLLAYLCTKL